MEFWNEEPMNLKVQTMPLLPEINIVVFEKLYPHISNNIVVLEELSPRSPCFLSIIESSDTHVRVITSLATMSIVSTLLSLIRTMEHLEAFPGASRRGQLRSSKYRGTGAFLL